MVFKYRRTRTTDNKFPFIKDLNSVSFFSLQHTLFKEKRGNEKVRVVMCRSTRVTMMALLVWQELLSGAKRRVFLEVFRRT